MTHVDGKQTATLSNQQARELTARIRDALAVADDLVVQAYHGRVWEPLGYPTWDAYCAGELPELRAVRLRPEADLRRLSGWVAEGLSVRAISSVTGLSKSAVARRLETVTRPETVQSLDGRVRPSKVDRPTPEPVPELRIVPEPVEEPTVWQVAVQHVTRAGEAGLTCLEFEEAAGWRHGAASSALYRAERKGHIRRDGRRRQLYAVYVPTRRP